MPYDTAQVRGVLEPHGFTVHEIGAFPSGVRLDALRPLQATSHFGGTARIGPRDHALLRYLQFPGHILGDDTIRAGIKAHREFSGRALVIRDFAHLQAAAPNLVPYFEGNSGAFLCPRCRGLKRIVSPHRGGKSFLGCSNYQCYPKSCDWTSTMEADAPWHLSP